VSWCTWTLVYEDDNMNATCYSIMDLKIYIGSQYSVVSIITRLKTELSEVRIPIGPRELSSPKCPGLVCGPPSLLCIGYQGLNSSGLKDDHALAYSAKVNNGCSRTATPPYTCMACTETSLPLFLYFLSNILVLLCADETLVSVKWVRHFGFCHILWKN
jgi:hypothetical protein